jgi:hypothetical protein
MVYSSSHRSQQRSARRFPHSLYAAPLARAIRERRNQLRLTLDQAARAAGFSLPQWIHLEVGTWIPDQFSDMDAIAGVLGEGVATISFLCLLASGNNTGQM